MSEKMLRNKRGVTLIELIIVIAILGVILMAMYSMFFLELNTFSWSNQQFNIQSDVRLASNVLTKEIRYATSMEIIPADDCVTEIASGTVNDYIYIKAGALNFAIYDSASGTHKVRTYAGIYEAESTFTKVTDDTIKITLAGMEGTKVFKLSSDILLRNFGIASPAKVIGGTSGVGLKFKKTL